jgi:hypothetical protein
MRDGAGAMSSKEDEIMRERMVAALKVLEGSFPQSGLTLFITPCDENGSCLEALYMSNYDREVCFELLEDFIASMRRSARSRTKH